MNETFRPRSNYIWAGSSLFLLILFGINSILVIDSAMQRAFEVTICVGLGAVAYLIWIRPKFILRDEAIEVINPIGTELIPYTDVIELQTKWVLTIVHSRGITKVWVAPATGKGRWIADKKFGWFGSNLPYSAQRESGMESMSESLDSVSGQAAYMIRERIKRAH
jgi:hypothetical protein